MIALDTNVLVYAHRSDNDFQPIVRTAIAQLIDRGLPWGIPVACMHEFLAVVTNARIFRDPTPRDLAFSQIEALLAQPGVRLLLPTDRHLMVLHRISDEANATGGQIHDARIAALCIENGVSQLWSADRDFTAYKELQIRTPRDLVSVGP